MYPPVTTTSDNTPTENHAPNMNEVNFPTTATEFFKMVNELGFSSPEEVVQHYAGKFSDPEEGLAFVISALDKLNKMIQDAQAAQS